MTQHSTGPWVHGNKVGGRTYQPNTVFDANGKSVAMAYDIPINVALEEVEAEERSRQGLANARLIASAPGMLSALRHAASVLSDYASTDTGAKGALKEVREAIEKAGYYKSGVIA